MKKLLLLLIISLPLLASSQFKQGVGIEYYQINEYKLYSPNIDYSIPFEKGDFAALYKLQYKFNDFKAEALTSIYMNKPSESWTFSPSHSEFTISLSYIIDKIKIKAEHVCVHPIITDSSRSINQMTGSSTKIGVYYNFD